MRLEDRQLMQFGESIAVYSENHTKHLRAICRENGRAFNIKVYVVTTILVTGYNFGVSNYLDFQKARSGLGQSIK